MALVVMKFGGSSVANRERIQNVAGIICSSAREGNEVVAVVSAQGDTTDELIAKAGEISLKPSKREMDMLLATGEQASAALVAMAVDALGVRSVALTGWQAGFNTNATHGSARIKHLDTERLRAELDRNNVVIVAGFQGVDPAEDITTLGRGGSDTSAVALAAALKAEVCKIYTDVDGVYTADPRKIKKARKLEEISFDEMLEMSQLGAQVLLSRSVELAKKYNVQVEVLSSLTGNPGTIVKEAVNVEGMLIRGVTKDTSFVSISVISVPDRTGIAYKLFSVLGSKGISVDVILQSVERDETRDISFTIAESELERALALLQEHKDSIGFRELTVDKDVAKVSIIGSGMISNAGVASRMFGALSDAGISIRMITTSEIQISVIVDRKEVDRAVEAVHDEFIK
ncbi:MAG: aspartate kinase [Oscillospiraceae bacterium]|nr:aspartate kinase [Oscillospiraceae bacterium]